MRSPPDGEIQITNGNGPVDVEATDGDTVEVRAERIATASNDAAAAEILPRMHDSREMSRSGKVAPQDRAARRDRDRRHDRSPLPRAGAEEGARSRAGGQRSVTVKGFAGRVILTAINGGLIADALGGGVEVRSTNGNAEARAEPPLARTSSISG